VTSSPPDSWQLAAELKPKKDGPDKKSDGGAGSAAPTTIPPAWVAGADGVRTTVKWMVTAFAAVGAVMFAKGFVTTPKLAWEDDTEQLVWAWIVGALGLFALGWLITQAVSVLRPSLFELADLPPKFTDMVNALPKFYLPHDVSNFEQFLSKYVALQELESKWRLILAGHTQAHSARNAELGDAIDELKTAKADFDAAQGQSPADPQKVAAATQRRNEARGVVAARRAAVATAAEELQKTSLTYDSVKWSLAVYNSTRQNLLDRAGYWQAAQGLSARGGSMVFAAILAAVGGIGYQLLLATPDAAEDDSDKPAAAAPSVGTLTRTDTAAGEQLWGQLSLVDCQPDPNAATIPVVVSGGKGSVTDPYVVTTLSTATCVAMTFTVINDVALVWVPPATAITYTPAPTQSPSPGGTSPTSPLTEEPSPTR
jgi:hypothetical protein